jgi:RNA polymerase sigma factor (sigma-70 family)
MTNLHFKYLKPTLSEEELVKGLKKQDRNAFSYLYEHYAPGMISCIYKIINDKEAAEDLMHDAFLKIWKNIKMYDSTKGRLYTWINNVCRNTAIDATRLAKRTRVRNNNLETLQTVTVDTHKVVVNKIDASIVNKKVSGLKTEQRVVIDMAFKHGLSHYEIASTLEMPVGTVKSRLYQGLRIIKLAMSA